MPSVALNKESGKKEFAARAKSERRYVCPKCKQKVAFVRSHRRGKDETKVRPFFRYDNCTHKGQKTVRESADGGAGGNGGEDPKHIRRKEDAMNYALNIFPDADYRLEKQVGERDSEMGIKQADALIVFDEPDEKYGKGLAIEYQNKNESKNRAATEKHFAKHHYTTIWLWDEQFDYSKSPVDVDLYGGEVYTPWPDAVPEQSEWRDIGFARKQLDRWERSYELGIKSVEVPATTIRGWFIPTQREFWEGNVTLKQFSVEQYQTYKPLWEKRFRFKDGYKEEHHRLQASIPYGNSSVRIPALSLNHWYWPTTKQYWDSQPWNNRFRTIVTDRLNDLAGEHKTNVTVNYINNWLLENKNLLHSRIGYAWESDKRLAIECPNCGKQLKTDQRYKGENKRGKRCQHCDNWFNVFEETDHFTFT